MTLVADPDTENGINCIGWKTAPGAHWDVLWLGDSNVASVPYNALEVAPGRTLALLPCGLPGNGVVGLEYWLVEASSLFATVAPKVVGICIGTNDCVVANQASWLTVAAWATCYAKIITAALAHGASVVCETYPLPEAGHEGYVSTPQLQAYNAAILTTLHDQFYYPTPTRFAICNSQGLFSPSGAGAVGTPGYTIDGVHLTPASQALRRGYWIQALQALPIIFTGGNAPPVTPPVVHDPTHVLALLDQARTEVAGWT